jgi:hypothetical protein
LITNKKKKLNLLDIININIKEIKKKKRLRGQLPPHYRSAPDDRFPFIIPTSSLKIGTRRYYSQPTKLRL